MTAKRPALMLDLPPAVYEKYMELSYPIKRRMRADARDALVRMIEARFEERFGAGAARPSIKSSLGEQPERATRPKDDSSSPKVEPPSTVPPPKPDQARDFVPVAYPAQPQAQQELNPPTPQDHGPTLESIGLDASGWS